MNISLYTLNNSIRGFAPKPQKEKIKTDMKVPNLHFLGVAFKKSSMNRNNHLVRPGS
jgi:hypothetical protein